MDVVLQAAPQARAQTDQTVRQAFRQRLAAMEADLNQLGAIRALQQIVIAGLQLVDQLEILGARAEPVLAGGDLVEIELRPVFGDERLEQAVRVLELLAELCARSLGVLAEQCQRAFELAGGVQFVVDIETPQGSAVSETDAAVVFAERVLASNVTGLEYQLDLWEERQGIFTSTSLEGNRYLVLVRTGDGRLA